MVKKITVSLPDELYEEIQNYKEEFKASKVFQKYAKIELKKIERYSKEFEGVTSMEETIERLKREKESHLEKIEENARQAAFKWCQQAHYDDLVFSDEWYSKVHKGVVDPDQISLTKHVMQLEDSEDIEGRMLFKAIDEDICKILNLGWESNYDQIKIFIEGWFAVLINFYGTFEDESWSDIPGSVHGL